MLCDPNSSFHVISLSLSDLARGDCGFGPYLLNLHFCSLTLNPQCRSPCLHLPSTERLLGGSYAQISAFVKFSDWTMASMEVSLAGKGQRSKNRLCYWGGKISDYDATYHRKHYGGKRGGYSDLI